MMDADGFVWFTGNPLILGSRGRRLLEAELLRGWECSDYDSL
jgi:hypothetical protein